MVVCKRPSPTSQLEFKFLAVIYAGTAHQMHALIANTRVSQWLQFNKADYAGSMSQLLAADWDEVVHRLQTTHKRMAR